MKLPSVLDLSAAGPLRSQLMERRGQKLEVDGAEVERLGGLCLQVLMAARNQWRVDGAEFRIVNASPAFLDGVRLMAAADLTPQAEAS